MKKFPILNPFFWLKGEDTSIILEELEQIKNSGITECILESRPHPDWMGEKFFETLHVIFDYAEKNNMRLWMFDDVHYPSGFANGKLPENSRKLNIRCRPVDVIGSGGRYTIKAPLYGKEKFFKVICAPFVMPNNFDASQATDLTGQVVDNVLTLDLPEGHFRIFFINTTIDGNSKFLMERVNMLDYDAVTNFIDLAIAPYYEKLKKYFDNGVFAGIFSDEPSIGTEFVLDLKIDGKYNYLPFSFSLAKDLENEDTAFYPSLFFECENSAVYRTKFMDKVSKLYSQSFSQQIGKWCHDHNVQYIGHIIEDSGAHCRLGYGAGHFFRAQQGQDFAMIDTVLHQNLPGFEEGIFVCGFGRHDAEFFHFGLAKLASSAAHLYPNFNHQAICESFGAYGWSFGLDQMKRLTDHLGVQGINALVPHAFSCAEFPDSDCPPHFYARGKNQQWKFFKLWADYCKRVYSLLSDGIHISGAAVLYHAEAEWSCKDYTPYEKVGSKLIKAHYDYDVVPFDILENAGVTDGKMVINGETFNILIVTKGSLLAPQQAILDRLQNDGLKVIYSDDIDEAESYLNPICTKETSPSIRFYQYQCGNEKRIFIVNESPDETFEFDMTINASYLYDAYNDCKYQYQKHLRLNAGESLFVIDDGKHYENLPLFPSDTEIIAEKTVYFADELDFTIHCKTIDRTKRFFIECTQNLGVLEINCNNNKSPVLFAPPYRMEISDCIQNENNISLKITTTPVNETNSMFDRDIPKKIDIRINIIQTN